jgi:hypothetical protein
MAVSSAQWLYRSQTHSFTWILLIELLLLLPFADQKLEIHKHQVVSNIGLINNTSIGSS